MGAGRPLKADPGSLYNFAHQFYWDFRRLAEGRQRWTLDRVKVQEFERERENLSISAEAAKKAQEEIAAGLLAPSRKQERCRELEDHLSSVLPLWPFVAREEAMKQVRIPGEPEVINELLDPATTPERIREVCKDAVMTRIIQVEPGVQKEVEVPAWPIPVGSPFPTYLSEYAEQYTAALHDPRFPRCDVSIRPSNRLKQFWFLSRALAGALFGVTTRTAINLVGSLRPEEIFQECRDAKPARKRVRRKYKTRKLAT
jgi:hypothetical protein